MPQDGNGRCASTDTGPGDLGGIFGHASEQIAYSPVTSLDQIKHLSGNQMHCIEFSCLMHVPSLFKQLGRVPNKMHRFDSKSNRQFPSKTSLSARCPRNLSSLGD